MLAMRVMLVMGVVSVMGVMVGMGVMSVMLVMSVMVGMGVVLVMEGMGEFPTTAPPQHLLPLCSFAIIETSVFFFSISTPGLVLI